MNDEQRPPGQPQVVYVERKSNGLAVAALTCGIVGLVLGLIPILFFIAWALGITAFVLGLVARGRVKRDPEIGRRKMATWGVWLGVAAFAMGCVGFAVLDDIFSDTEEDLEQIERDLERDLENVP
jgi:lysylphosphatidylglycerol synthetase-like protein (DUF2156 family)